MELDVNYPSYTEDDWLDYMEFDWLAADAAGQIATFSAATQGPIPIAVLADLHAAERAMSLVEALPERSECHLLIDLPCPCSFVELAVRGLFVYDWQDFGRNTCRSNRYELIARLSVPILLNELDGELATLIQRVRFRSLRFDDLIAIAVNDYLDCR